MTKLPQTLGELRHSRWSEEKIASRSVRQEMRENVLALLERGEPLFPGIPGEVLEPATFAGVYWVAPSGAGRRASTG